MDSLATTCSHCERLGGRAAKSRTLFVKLNHKYHPYSPGIGTDLLDLANNSQVDLLVRREVLAEISEFYLSLNKHFILNQPDNFTPNDNELLHIVVAADIT